MKRSHIASTCLIQFLLSSSLPGWKSDRDSSRQSNIQLHNTKLWGLPFLLYFSFLKNVLLPKSNEYLTQIKRAPRKGYHEIKGSADPESFLGGKKLIEERSGTFSPSRSCFNKRAIASIDRSSGALHRAGYPVVDPPMSPFTRRSREETRGVGGKEGGNDVLRM